MITNGYNIIEYVGDIFDGHRLLYHGPILKVRDGWVWNGLWDPTTGLSREWGYPFRLDITSIWVQREGFSIVESEEDHELYQCRNYT